MCLVVTNSYTLYKYAEEGISSGPIAFTINCKKSRKLLKQVDLIYHFHKKEISLGNYYDACIWVCSRLNSSALVGIRSDQFVYFRDSTIVKYILQTQK